MPTKTEAKVPAGAICFEPSAPNPSALSQPIKEKRNHFAESGKFPPKRSWFFERAHWGRILAPCPFWYAKRNTINTPLLGVLFKKPIFADCLQARKPEPYQ
ncbi:hypothetical protein CS022_01860 [Veronia nyctiphanis]|uniref:Uncharacterized protein n=1 Tax=Veronia nyctiphanis TaxID=1278244 RepID=A0A4Q0Z0K0_9GAMM|nr:hypothetical protein CS022_01860 [Veronia nyctiphanis]